MRGLLITAAPTAEAPAWDPGSAWRLDPDVALRPEPFGALAYHYGSRRLTFLRDLLLVDLVRQLGDHDSANAALEALVPEARRASFLKALAGLASSRFLIPNSEDPDADR